ncbi:sugar MFS transporter [Pseudoalteromonas peptidolytica]|uniref:MFS transporter, FHS family, L-fucose permease n=1 Tax=Pseudoalteromonas peptidolytica F12-50-A1 TaxID=1315280 RepID=A0A8I0N1G0_9GAMM|nr:sugar MFS transporter [Pseudoalteromonas peptidolytica]MBE0348809.1 MFS transporter, FHS family, L-fucose permease [Pseudoalteromonas peptidolytica F12-50-A1]MDW7548672.1 sugar MFS transporter [Pseudoalteromonas peptidolytica]NLR16796.1 sugar MFS transporter [Pseudoalteromonas peptidolytica]GEK09049.1 glucose/galactose MFS transporter [Pseudoalteromonas peptidolytica]
MSELNTKQTFVTSANAENNNYRLPLIAMTTLFFLWGFITVLNDVLIPRLKGVFDLSYTEAMLIQFCFFSAYFIISLPAGHLVKRFGYKNGVMTGLIVASLGCMIFYPAVVVHEYWIFLSALFVLASGITILQVSANPYVAALGDPKTASSRLNLAQALNALGTTVGPIVGGILLFGTAGTLTVEAAANADSVKIPYLILAAALLSIAIVFAFLKLPIIAEHTEAVDCKAKNHKLIQAPHLVMGVFAIFSYVGAEVAIGSFLVNYFAQPEIAGLKEHAAAKLIGYYWGGAMVGRFIGSAVLKTVAPSKAVAFNAVVIILLLALTMSTQGNIAMIAVLAIGLFNSIMFPTIFSMAIEGLGSLTSKGSGWLCLAIVGGAIVPLLQGVVADNFHIQISFIVPLVFYVYIAWYGLNVIKLSQKWQTRLN